MMNSDLLEKWQCHSCEKGWLMRMKDIESQKIVCPFCGGNNKIEAVAGQNPNDDLKGEMGCLWPGYNEFDKLAYKISRNNRLIPIKDRDKNSKGFLFK